MAELFSAEWMNQLKDAWNDEPEVRDKLAEIGFSSVITCGFKDEDQPRGVFVVENGECVRAGDYADEAPDWDMGRERPGHGRHGNCLRNGQAQVRPR